MSPWVWLLLFVLVAAAQVWGMRTGVPFSRVVQRVTERSRVASMFLGALFFWLPIHFFTARATTVTVWDYVAIAVGLVVGAVVHERRKRERIRSGRRP